MILNIFFMIFMMVCQTSNTSEITLPNDLPMVIVQQPKGDPLWISNNIDAFTQIEQPRKEFGTSVFAIHTYGSKNDLYDLKINDFIVYKTISIDNNCNVHANLVFYRVKDILRYQALSPRNPATPLIDLVTGKQYSVESIIDKVYGNNEYVILQTCIYKNGNTAWGRLFVVLEEIKY